VAQRRKAGALPKPLLLPSISETVLLNKSLAAVVSLLPDPYFPAAPGLNGISGTYSCEWPEPRARMHDLAEQRLLHAAAGCLGHGLFLLPRLLKGLVNAETRRFLTRREAEVLSAMPSLLWMVWN
jgi:hypothetical protein